MERMLAKLFHETVGRGIAGLREGFVLNKLSGLEAGEYFVPKVPVYISQIADADRSKIHAFYGGIEDVRAARRFGTNELGEFSYWSWRSCGIVGVQMVLKTILGEKFNKTTMDLVNEGYLLGGYDKEHDIGWFHEVLVRLAKKYGVLAETRRFIPSSEIALLILDRNYVLASIESTTGGHLLLVYGFTMGENGKLEGFFVHDPNNYRQDGEQKLMDKRALDALFTRRIIALSSK